MIKVSRQAGRLAAGVALLFAVLVFGGCKSQDALFQDIPESTPTAQAKEAPRANGASSANVPTLAGPIFRVGDAVSIRFSGIERPPPAHEERIKEDGTIKPPEIPSVVAAGKSAGQLQNELQQMYDKLYRGLTVTVVSGALSYSVGGEVRAPGPKLYEGETTVVKAIQAAGDFTEFANKKNVLLVHSDGRTETVNVSKAIKDPKYDRPVYPGDRISVKRRIFW
jgi:polysaccharide export outer membrane protein